MKRLALALLAAGCGADTPAATPDAGTPDVFVAFAADFMNFHGWTQFDVTATGIPDPVHPDQMLIEYLNHRPPAGATEFPVGTIIVKEGTGGDPETRQFFAMVKRGGGYNAFGAAGWEWFELQNLVATGGVQVIWRGVGPPAGETYGGDPNAGCNTCHADCGNDGVCAPALKIGGL